MKGVKISARWKKTGLIISILALIGLISCKYSDDTEDIEPIRISVGINENFSIRLMEGGGTGYAWKPYYSDYYLKLKSDDTEPLDPDNIQPGSPHYRIFIFKACHFGKTELTFKYYRPWEPDDTAIEIKRYIITIDQPEV